MKRVKPSAFENPFVKGQDKRRLERLRKELWNKNSVRNPIAKELLQGDGRLGAKVIEQKNQDPTLTRKPKYGKNQWLKQLEEETEDENL